MKIAYTLKTPLKDVELSEDGKKAVLKAVEFLKAQGFSVEEVTEFPIDGYEGIKTYTVNSIGYGSNYVEKAKKKGENGKYDLDPATYTFGSSSTKGNRANTDISGVKPASEYKKSINEFYKKYDLFLMATNAVTAPSNNKRFELLVKQWEPMMRRTPFTWLFNLTGNPAISLPVYVNSNNLPLGVMFAAQDNSEKILLEIAQLFQDNNQFKLHPSITNNATTKNGNKVATNDYGTKFEYKIPDVAPTNPKPELKIKDNQNTDKNKTTKTSQSANNQDTDYNNKNTTKKILPKTGLINSSLSLIKILTFIIIGISLILKRKVK